MTLWNAQQVAAGIRARGGPPLAGPVLFLDRDGVVVEERNYLKDPEEVALVPGAAEAIRRARASGYHVIGVSNQSGIGRGLYRESDFAAVQRRVDALLAAAGAAFDAFFYCPHAPEQGCRCRKPAPGLLEEASRLFCWPDARSWVVGDKLADVELGLAAGLQVVLVRSGHGCTQEGALAGRGVPVREDLAAAVDFILGRDRE
jgi:D-glycero-D-manno-heptose 1,7-bisphosphate phosphatase